jgi:hypothetical protein
MSDATDIADADAFKDLCQNIALCSELAPSTDLPAIDDLPGVPNHVEALANWHKMGNIEMMPMVIVDYFPSGQAGAPIAGIACGSSIYNLCEDMHANSEWAPFTSQHDWLFACWAKMHGPTSSLLEDLLRIPEVWFLLFILPVNYSFMAQDCR